MSDFFPVNGFDHVEFFVGNARQSAVYYEQLFGFRVTATKGLETGSRDVASYLLEQGHVRFVLSSAIHPDHLIAEHVKRHGDGVGIIALTVPDAEKAWREATSRGAQGVLEPRAEEDEHGTIITAAVQSYGDTLFKFVQRDGYSGRFAPGFADAPERANAPEDCGLVAIDHIVGNVELGKMDVWTEWFAKTMGFEQLAHFTEDQISTEYSSLMSKVMQNGTGVVKFPINEPAEGRRKSQIAEYLEYYHGPGVQHVALNTTDIIKTVSRMRERGVSFLNVPKTYYEDLEARVGKIDEDMERLAELGILVDRDDEGYLLQLFTQPVQDRPTVFYEVIERHGCRGFGEGNFKSLFEAIEREQALRGNL